MMRAMWAALGCISSLGACEAMSDGPLLLHHLHLFRAAAPPVHSMAATTPAQQYNGCDEESSLSWGPVCTRYSEWCDTDPLVRELCPTTCALPCSHTAVAEQRSTVPSTPPRKTVHGCECQQRWTVNGALHINSCMCPPLSVSRRCVRLRDFPHLPTS